MEVFIVDDETKEAFLLTGDLVPLDTEELRDSLREGRVAALLERQCEYDVVETGLKRKDFPDWFSYRQAEQAAMAAGQFTKKTEKSEFKSKELEYTMKKLTPWLEGRTLAALHVIDGEFSQQLFKIGVEITGTCYSDESTEDFRTEGKWIGEVVNFGLPPAQPVPHKTLAQVDQLDQVTASALDMAGVKPLKNGTRHFGRLGTDWKRTRASTEE